VSGDIQYVFVVPKSFTGTWGNTDGLINYNIHTGWSSTSVFSPPADALLHAGTITLAGTEADEWVKSAAIADKSVVQGKAYFLEIYDNDGDGTDNVVMRMHDTAPARTTDKRFHWMGASASTADNYASNVANRENSPPFVAIQIAGQVFVGATYSSSAASGNNSHQKGIKFTPDRDCVLVGLCATRSSDALLSNENTYKLYTGTTGPVGTPAETIVLPETSGFPRGAQLMPIAPIDLSSGTTYRLVHDPAGNIAEPYVFSAFTAVDTGLRKGIYMFEDNYCYTEEDTEDELGSWADNINQTCAILPVFAAADNAPAAASNTNPFQSASIR